jgi:hypothetical protein
VSASLVKKDNPLAIGLAFQNAACDDSGTIISGREIDLTALAQSRYVLQATRIDSVPPDVVVPAPAGLFHMLRTIDT